MKDDGNEVTVGRLRWSHCQGLDLGCEGAMCWSCMSGNSGGAIRTGEAGHAGRVLHLQGAPGRVVYSLGRGLGWRPDASAVSLQ